MCMLHLYDNVFKLQNGQTFLMVACQYGEPVIIEELLTGDIESLDDGKTDVNAVDNVSIHVHEYVMHR